MAVFLDLPNELLVSIFSTSLEDDKLWHSRLYQYTGICKRVQEILLLPFLRSKGALQSKSIIFPNIGGASSICILSLHGGKTMRLLPILTASKLFRRNLTHLHCSFGIHHTYKTEDKPAGRRLVADLHNLSAFLVCDSSLTSQVTPKEKSGSTTPAKNPTLHLADLRHLTLDFTNVEFCIMELMEMLGDGNVKDTLKQFLQDLLSVLACQRPASDTPEPPPGIQRTISIDLPSESLNTLSLLSGVHLVSRRWPSVIGSALQACTHSSCSSVTKSAAAPSAGACTLELHSRVFMDQNSFFKDIFSSLSLDSITHFSLGFISLQECDWSSRFPYLRFTSLVSLSLIQCNLPAKLIIPFLERQPEIATLRLGAGLPLANIKLLSTSEKFAAKSLPQLTHVVSEIAYLPWLFGGESKPRQTTTALSLCISCSITRLISFAQVSKQLESVADMIRPYSVSLYVSMDDYSVRGLTIPDTVDPSILALYDTVQAIEFVSTFKEIRGLTDYLPSWLARFRNLRLFALPVASYPTIRKKRDALVWLLMCACPNLRSICFPSERACIVRGAAGRFAKFS